ncbi:MAG: hypothetical protein NZ928_03260 [Endomicrobia bacterium]|nr:hypothetical protein [Endomicrobiia bacterium]MCX7940835.1 hypothetical protein [Endomicrobiia bacterium]MDW8055517.1 hypothetical protein [Elusimicrobiota bacterium]
MNIIKNLTILLIVTILVFVNTACAPKKPKDVRKEVAADYEEAIPFVTLPEEIEGKIITGIGFSEKRANLALARDAALTSALADLARKIETKVESVWKRTMADWSEYKQQGVNEAMSVEEMKVMSKNIVDTELRGPWYTQEKIQKSTGRYWVRILLSSATVEKWVKQRMNDENLLKKYIIESQVKKVQEDLQKDLDAVREKERQDIEKIKSLTTK